MIELKKCRDCGTVYDGDKYECSSCIGHNIDTKELTQILNELQSDIRFLHQNKADKEIEKID